MRRIILLAIGTMALASCETQQSLYSWYNSEDATYMYVKRNTEETLTKAMAQYEKVISKQKGLRKTVPPGVNAEYGYLLYKAGKKEEGLTLLRAEITAYPESKTFISRIINQLEK
ncbi:MAG: DUF4810 domain-containing protein [Bacteroidaceae bacterium]|nr:DUF4810 domain-containing protein [Bacteroidaceae bacterium]